MNKIPGPRASLAVLIVVLSTRAIQGAEVVSAPFSFGFGWTGPSGSTSWNTSETTATNTATTQGDFSFAAAPVGDNFSSDGVRFPDRVLTNEPLPSTGFSSWLKPNFLVPVTASYNGGAPANAAATPNYRLRLEISKVSIWGGEHSSSDESRPLVWDETTTDHLATSPTPLQLPISNDFNEAAAYAQLVWDPDDYDVPLTNLTDPFTRTFDILVDAPGDLRFLDGLEVEGRVVLVYEGLPVQGDYNVNSVVDAADYVLWRQGGTLQNDASPPNNTPEDYTFWRSRFGAISGAGSGLGGALVPEPSSIVLFLTALLPWRNRRGFQRLELS